MITKAFRILLLALSVSFVACSSDPFVPDEIVKEEDNDEKEEEETDKEEEEDDQEQEQPEPVKPFLDVVFRIDSTQKYIIKDAYSADTLYNIDENKIRVGSNADGEVAYTIVNNLIYLGEDTKSNPLYYIEGEHVALSNTYQIVFKRTDLFFRKSSGKLNIPLESYLGEVAFNIDGQFLRQGKDANGKILFTRDGNKLYQGEGTNGNFIFYIEGDKIRLANTGSILFTIRDRFIYKGQSTNVVSFNIDNNYIRKGKNTLSLGEN